MPSTHLTHEFLPTIHRNGTSPEQLSEDYLKASRALNSFREAFSQIEFNARDYYLREGHWLVADQKRKEMNEHIKSLSEYLAVHRMHLSNHI